MVNQIAPGQFDQFGLEVQRKSFFGQRVAQLAQLMRGDQVKIIRPESRPHRAGTTRAGSKVLNHSSCHGLHHAPTLRPGVRARYYKLAPFLDSRRDARRPCSAIKTTTEIRRKRPKISET